MQVMCMGCEQPLEVEAPRQELINRITVSMIVIEHPEQAFCPNCKAAVTVQVGGHQGLLLVAVPVPPAAQKRLIVMPGVQ